WRDLRFHNSILVVVDWSIEPKPTWIEVFEVALVRCFLGLLAFVFSEVDSDVVRSADTDYPCVTGWIVSVGFAHFNIRVTNDLVFDYNCLWLRGGVVEVAQELLGDRSKFSVSFW